MHTQRYHLRFEALCHQEPFDRQLEEENPSPKKCRDNEHVIRWIFPWGIKAL